MGRLFDSPVHLLILLLVIVVLFGAKRLPDAAKGIGRSLRILKTEVREMQDDGKPRQDTTAAPAARPEPLEGRVVQPTDASTSDQRHDV